jgi:protoporphyrinogen oxidase
VKNAGGWAVVGGGLLGMTVAHTLAKMNCDVTVFESAPACGGLACAWQIGDIVWDRHYHVTLFSDQALRGLLSELGLDADMRWKKTRTGFYSNGVIYPFSNALDYLRFPLLNPIEKLRLASTIVRASRLKDWHSIEDITVEEWLTRLSGSSVFQKIWRPLLLAKLGADYESTSATFLWATIQRLYAARRTGLKEELFGYLPGGYAKMLGKFESALTGAGVRILVNTKVRSIEKSPAGLQVRLDSGESFSFARVVVTVPSPVAPHLCPCLNEKERDDLAQIQYLGIICASVLLRSSISKYYVTNILDESIPFTGLIEMSALVDASEFKNHGLLYIPRYLRPNHPDFAKSDDELQREMLSSLKRMHPSLADDDVLAFKVSRVRYVFPRPTLGYSRQVPAIDSSVPGLSIVNSAHILNGTLNANETIGLAQREARRLHALAN